MATRASSRLRSLTSVGEGVGEGEILGHSGDRKRREESSAEGAPSPKSLAIDALFSLTATSMGDAHPVRATRSTDASLSSPGSTARDERPRRAAAPSQGAFAPGRLFGHIAEGHGSGAQERRHPVTGTSGAAAGISEMDLGVTSAAAAGAGHGESSGSWDRGGKSSDSLGGKFSEVRVTKLQTWMRGAIATIIIHY